MVWTLLMCLYFCQQLSSGISFYLFKTCMLTCMSIMEVTHFRGPNIIVVSQYEQLTVQLSIEVYLERFMSYYCKSAVLSFTPWIYVFTWLKSTKIIQLSSRPFTYSVQMFDRESRYTLLQTCFLWFVRLLHICSYILWKKKFSVIFWILYNLTSSWGSFCVHWNWNFVHLILPYFLWMNVTHEINSKSVA
jgi:hypothetical protein